MSQTSQIVFCLVAVAAPLAATGHASAQGGAAVIRRADGSLAVQLLKDRRSLGLENGHPALVVWAGEETEEVDVVPPSEGPLSKSSAASRSLLAPSRGSGAAAGGDALVFASDFDQLLGHTAIRGSGFITPPQGGRLLGHSLTIRRQKDPSGNYEAETVELRRDGRRLAQLKFAAGQPSLNLFETPDLPESLKKGLLAGEYTLQPGKGAGTTFTVEEEHTRQAIQSQLARLEKHLKGVPTLYLQAATALLIGRTDPEGVRYGYLADAFDLLDQHANEVQSSPRLTTLQANLLSRLTGDRTQSPPHKAEQPSHSASIQPILRCLEECQWGRALELIAEAEQSSDEQVRNLAIIYRAVVMAEAGTARAYEVEGAFEYATQSLTGSPHAYRAHNNYAAFLIQRAQDRLHNASFYAATGIPRSLLAFLYDWQRAGDHLDAAIASLPASSPSDNAAIQVNRARLQLLLGEFLSFVTQGGADSRLLELREGAFKACLEIAKQVAGDSQSEPLLAAIARELEAQVAFRSAHWAQARRLVLSARQRYLEVGSLQGVESVERLAGLSALRDESLSDTQRRSDALAHFLASSAIAEVLRHCLPPDHIGLTRAGFFARRTFVGERIVELLIEQDQPAEALRFAEQCKAQSLRDVLEARGVRHGQAGESLAGGDSTMLADWPSDTVAIEYFLGNQTAWVFVVGCDGKVQAHALTSPDKESLSSEALIAKVHSFLRDVEGQSKKIRRRLVGGRGFDNAWQDQLHDLYELLIPEETRPTLAKAKRVLIVPHHILHYFPFVALVTERDTTATSDNFAKPQYLLDEPFAIGYAPSLAIWRNLRSYGDTELTDARALGIATFPRHAALPGVKEDLKNFQAAFTHRIQEVVTGQDVNEGSARELLARPGVLLIATHGSNDPDNPLESHLVVYDTRDGDSRLTASELFESEVGADLVVMSACYSGLADRAPLSSEDLFGIQRALLQSGARSVLSGLWDVYDGTGPHIMKRFFEKVAQKGGAAAALADAQRDFLKGLRESKEAEPWLHPHFWAVYTLSGDDRIGESAPSSRSSPQPASQD